MDSTEMITAMILVCLSLIVLMVFSKPIKFLLRIAANTVVGCAIIAVLHSLGLDIGINLLTAVFVGFLGLPGVAGLTALHFFL